MKSRDVNFCENKIRNLRGTSLIMIPGGNPKKFILVLNTLMVLYLKSDYSKTVVKSILR